jgi:hypothetical protein
VVVVDELTVDEEEEAEEDAELDPNEKFETTFPVGVFRFCSA